ncbi:MAG: EamA family transporter [Deltaproteobacteria bacterium]|nr:EamA family transporter [Deltaproteobacteria bacterium]
MPTWLIFAVLCVGVWGVWGFVAKLTTTQGVHPLTLSAISSITGVVATWLVWFSVQPPFLRSEQLPMTVLTGLCGSLGAVAFFLALSHGRAAIVVPLSALYPAITIMLSLIFLGKQPSVTQGVGIVLALIAAVLLGL